MRSFTVWFGGTLVVLFFVAILVPRQSPAVKARASSPPPAPAARRQPSSQASPTCGRATGETPMDMANALDFCALAVPKDLDVQSVRAMDSLLWIRVSRDLANVMRADQLSTEQVVKNWMRAWRAKSGKQVVTVYVEWQDVQIAKGETSLFSGDTVTIR